MYYYIKREHSKFLLIFIKFETFHYLGNTTRFLSQRNNWLLHFLKGLKSSIHEILTNIF